MNIAYFRLRHFTNNVKSNNMQGESDTSAGTGKSRQTTQKRLDKPISKSLRFMFACLYAIINALRNHLRS